MAAHSSECSVSVFWGLLGFFSSRTNLFLFPFFCSGKCFYLSWFIFHYQYFYYYDDLNLPQLFGFSPSFPVIFKEKEKNSRFRLLGGDYSINFLFFCFFLPFLHFLLFAGLSVSWCGLSSAWTGASWLALEGGLDSPAMLQGARDSLSGLQGPCCRSWKVLKGRLTLFDCIWTQPSFSAPQAAASCVTPAHFGSSVDWNPPPQICFIIHRILSFIWVFFSFFPLDKNLFEDVGTLWCHKGL